MTEKIIAVQAPKALPILLKEHCGLEGENFSAFKEEYAKLTQEDRDEFKALFKEAGIECK